MECLTPNLFDESDFNGLEVRIEICSCYELQHYCQLFFYRCLGSLKLSCTKLADSLVCFPERVRSGLELVFFRA